MKLISFIDPIAIISGLIIFLSGAYVFKELIMERFTIEVIILGSLSILIGILSMILINKIERINNKK